MNIFQTISIMNKTSDRQLKCTDWNFHEQNKKIETNDLQADVEFYFRISSYLTIESAHIVKL